MRIQFLDFLLDARRRELIQADTPVRVSPKNFEVLVYLVENRERMVPKSELMEQFWSQNTSDAALQKSISQLRRCFSSGDSDAEVIKTYHGRGFRFVAPSQELASDSGNVAEAQNNLGEVRTVTLLCALMPEIDSGVAPSTQAAMEQAESLVNQHGGQLLQTLMNGFIASFGSAPVFEDSARLAAHCAGALVRAKGQSWQIGLDNGALGLETPSRNERWVLPGHLEQGAARLAQEARVNDVLLSKAVLDQLQDEVETEPHGEVFRLVSLGPLRTGIPGRPRKRLSRYVGREPDLNFLKTQLDLAQKGRGQVVEISGPPGIGKTRVVAEFIDRLDSNVIRCEHVHCLPSLRNTPYAPLGALCRNLGNPLQDDILLDDVDAALWRSLIDESRKKDAATLADLSDRRRQACTLALLLRLLESAVAGACFVLVFEDVHWLDPASRMLVAELLNEVERHAWMFVVTTRPVEAASLTERTLHLAPLTKVESCSLLKDAAEGSELSPDQINTLARRADGNPFFLEELALTAASGGDPVKEIPSTIHAVIATRIGKLDLQMRQLLYVIAVLRTPANPTRVAQLMKRSEEDVAARAQVLTRMGFLSHDPQGYVFNHMLIDDTAYAMIDPIDRRVLHGEIAELLENSETVERPEQLAWHQKEAGNVAKAIGSWIAASRQAIQRAAWTEAAAFAENGLSILQPDLEDVETMELALLLCQAPALIALRGFPAPEVGQAYDRASDLNKRVGDPKSEIRVRVGQWINTWVRGALDESLAHAEALVVLSRKFPDPALALQGHASRGQVLMHMGNLRESFEQLSLGLSAIEDSPPSTTQAQNSAVSCAAYASWVASMMGDSETAKSLLTRSLELSELRNNPYATAIHHALCLETFMFLGDVAKCLEYSDAAIRVSRENDYTFWLGTGLVMRGWCLGQSNDFKEGLQDIREGIRVFANTGAGVQLANWHGLHAEVLLRSGDWSASLDAASLALKHASDVGDNYFTPRIHSMVGIALVELGRFDEARIEADRAKELARTFNMCREAYDLGSGGQL